jgi:hypothetical protein
VLSTVPREIALAITIKIKPARHHPACYGSFPDGGVHDLALPRNVVWKTDVHRDKRMHDAPAFRRKFRPTSSVP